MARKKSDSKKDVEVANDTQPRVYSVTEVTRDIRAILEAAFDELWIEGEISNLRVPQSQHSYFVLKDGQSQIRCVLFKNQRAGLKYDPEDGDQVLLFGRVTVYDARGEYQIIVETMEPRGLGALQKKFEQLKEKLLQEGLFDEEAKKPLPELPWRVGVVTSPTGAAISDILNILRRRNPKLSVRLYPVKVQGEGAAEEIASAIKALNRFRDIDVLIVGRGGGSLEDLWAFNEECVARAIFNSRIPVVSAVGHEIDFTIADFVADLRAPTPSAAAELVTPVLGDIVYAIRSLTMDMIEALRERIDDNKERLRHWVDRRFFREPGKIIEPHAQRLDDLTLRLLRGLDQWVVVQKERLAGKVRQLFLTSPEKEIRRLKLQHGDLHHMLVRQMASQVTLGRERFDGIVKNLNGLSPLAILDRGYSITVSRRTNKSVKSSRDVNKGDSVRVRLAQGRLDCTVDETLE